MAQAHHDDLAAHYRAMLEDASVSADDKKAAQLFVDSEGKLNNEEDHEAALKLAQEAHGIFKGSNHEQGKADTLRLVVHAHRLHADTLRYKTKGDTVKGPVGEKLRECEKFAIEEMNAFKSSGSKLGEAAMHLALAELNADRRGHAKRTEAMLSAREAMKLYLDLNDKKGQGATWLAFAKIHNKNNEPASTLKAAQDALALFKETGNLKGEAKAHHAIGAAHSMSGNFHDAAKAGDKALKVLQSCGSQKMVAYEMFKMAEWQLQGHHNREAQHSAGNAARIFQEIGYGKGWQANAVDLQIQAHLAAGDRKEAVKLAEENVKRFKKEGGDTSEKRDEVIAMGGLIKSHAESGDVDKALEVHEPALDICRQELEDKQWQVGMLMLGSQVHRKRPGKEGSDRAVTVLREAQKLLKDLGDKNNEGSALHMMADVNIRGKEDYRAAITMAKEEMAIFTTTGDKTREANAMLMLACAHLFQKENDVAMSTATEAQRTFAETEDRMGEARAYNTIASVHLAKQQFTEAAEAAQQSRSMAQKIGNLRLELSALNLGANINLYKDTLAGAQDAGRLAMEGITLAKKQGDQVMEVDTLLTACMAFMAVSTGEAAQSKDPQRTLVSWGAKAVKPAVNAVAICKKMKDQEGTVALRAASVYCLASAHMVVAKFADAMAEANEAKDLYKTAKDKKGELTCEILCAEVHFCKGDKDAALRLANMVFEEGGKLNENNLQYRAQQLQMRIQGQATAAAGGGDQVAVKKGLDPADVEIMVKAAVADSIDVDEEGGVDMDTPMMDSGMDSLSSVAFRNVLQKKAGMTLPASLMFDYPTPRAIIQQIIDLSLDK